MKEKLEELARLLGLSFSYDENKTICENLFIFLEALCEFLGGDCDG